MYTSFKSKYMFIYGKFIIQVLLIPYKLRNLLHSNKQILWQIRIGLIGTTWPINGCEFIESQLQ